MTAECGTSAGYYAHRTRGEIACSECREAKAERVRRNRSIALGNLNRHGYAGSYDAGCRCPECVEYRRARSRGDYVPAPRLIKPKSPSRTAQVRAWARAEGFEISTRGRIPNRVWNAWLAVAA